MGVCCPSSGCLVWRLLFNKKAPEAICIFCGVFHMHSPCTLSSGHGAHRTWHVIGHSECLPLKTVAYVAYKAPFCAEGICCQQVQAVSPKSTVNIVGCIVFEARCHIGCLEGSPKRNRPGPTQILQNMGSLQIGSGAWV